MRIALIRPRVTRSGNAQGMPLGYLSLAASIRERGHQPVILDMTLPHVTAAVVDHTMRAQHIQIAGIGCMTCEFQDAVREALRLRGQHPQLRIIFGGAHPTADPQSCMQCGAADFVIRGEGEEALSALLDDLEAGRTGDRIRAVQAPPDLLRLPRPAYDLLDFDAYFNRGTPWHFPKSQRTAQISTSRGCPYHCVYCHEIHGKAYRAFPASTVVDLIEWLVNSRGVEDLAIVDDLFNGELDRAKRICRLITERRIRAHLQFPYGLRGDRCDRELLQLLREAGAYYVTFAVETANAARQRSIGKNLNLDKTRSMMLDAQDLELETGAFFMIGFPGETREEVETTLNWALDAPLDAIFISLVSPFEGTALRRALGEGDVDTTDSGFPLVRNSELTQKVMRRLRLAAYLRFYGNPRPMIRLAGKMTSRANVSKLASALVQRLAPSRTAGLN